MTTFTIEMPESLSSRIHELGTVEGFTLTEFVVAAANEKLEQSLRYDALCRDAATGRREDFERVLRALPDCVPLPSDEIG